MAGFTWSPGQGALLKVCILVCLAHFNFYSVQLYGWFRLLSGPGCNYMAVSTCSQARVQLYDWFHLVARPGCNYVAGSTWLPSQGATI